MKKIIFFAVVAAALQSHATKYGMAGCGLGSIVFEDKPGKVQIVAAILNDWGSQTSAITTGTSNCTEGSGSMADLKYIEDNREALKSEVARGGGETVLGLLNIWGCEASAASTLKSNYASIFSEQNLAVVQVSDSMKSALKNQTCSKI